MPAPDHSLAALPPVVRAFVQTHRIPPDAIRSEGRLVLTLDQRWRVHVLPAPQQRVALQAELAHAVGAAHSLQASTPCDL